MHVLRGHEPEEAVRPSASEAWHEPWARMEPFEAIPPRNCKGDPGAIIGHDAFLYNASAGGSEHNVITDNAAFNACGTEKTVRPSASEAGLESGARKEPFEPFPPGHTIEDRDAARGHDTIFTYATASACEHNVITYNTAFGACETDKAIRPSASEAGLEPGARIEPFEPIPPGHSKEVHGAVLGHVSISHNATASACEQTVFIPKAAISACETGKVA